MPTPTDEIIRKVEEMRRVIDAGEVYVQIKATVKGGTIAVNGTAVPYQERRR